MIYEANDFPTVGANSQQFISALSDRVGSKNMIDAIIGNMPQIARRLGAKSPAPLPNIGQPRKALAEAMSAQPNPQRSAPMAGLHTPPAKMMPGADTKPGEPLSDEDAEALNRIMAERRSRDLIAATYAQPLHSPPPQSQQPIVRKVQPPSYFKDGLGNEYKIVDGLLYVLGWQDARVKVRMVNEETGKCVPSKGRKFQIYGWHLVERTSSCSEGDDVDAFESVVSDEDRNPPPPPRRPAKADLDMKPPEAQEPPPASNQVPEQPAEQVQSVPEGNPPETVGSDVEVPAKEDSPETAVPEEDGASPSKPASVGNRPKKRKRLL